jgi:CHASE3 domain sensor protein
MSEVRDVFDETHRRVAASGEPVTAALLSRILGEMEAEEDERHRRAMARARWKNLRQALLLFAPAAALLLLAVLLTNALCR